jgi:hypothetical protein
MAHFFLRLLGPRSDFAFTMTPAERELMQAHGVYWRGLLDKGVLVFGLVSHPESPFGVAIAKANDVSEIQAFAGADPVTKANQGFRWEIYPMRAVTRETA